MVLIGDNDRWWNRKLPMKHIGIMIALLLAGGWGFLYLMPPLQTVIWTIAHRSTASYQELSIKVPWMWRQEETPAGQRQIRLVRARWGEPVSLETIVIQKDASASRNTQTVTERFEALASKLGQIDFKDDPLPLTPEIARHYTCIVPHLAKLREWQVSCLSQDNLWSVNLMGPHTDRDVDDLITVLRNLSSAQKPRILP